MTIKNCIMQGNYNGIAISRMNASLSDSSSIIIQDCIIRDSKGMGVEVCRKSKDAGTLSFTNCFLKNNCVAVSNNAFCIASSDGINETGGNIQLNNIVVESPTNRAEEGFLSICGLDNSLIDNVSGMFYVDGGILYTENATNIDVASASSSPKSRWKMDEVSGSSVYDSNGSCNGTLYNSPAWAAGRIAVLL